MAKSAATETILGLSIEETYQEATLTLPDGTSQKVPVQRAKTAAGDIVWEQVGPKARADREFADRFANTDFKPAEWREPGTAAINRRQEDPNLTRRHLDAKLGMVVGVPEDILRNGKIDDVRMAHFQKNPTLVSLLHGLMHDHGAQEWIEVSKLLPKPLYQQV